MGIKPIMDMANIKLDYSICNLVMGYVGGLMEKITFIIWGVITLFQLHVVYKIVKLNKIVE